MDGPGAIAELPSRDPEPALRRFAFARGVLGWPTEPTVRWHQRAVSLALRAPVDLVDCAADLLEWASNPDTDDDLERLERRIQRHQNLPLRAILDAYPEAAFVGEGKLTVCFGHHPRSWSLEGPLPEVSSLRGAARVPTALITGTNGKTTTTRLLGHLARTAGMCPGCSTSGGVVIGVEKVVKTVF